MRLMWNGTDITGKCDITGCVHRDAAGGKSDTLDLQLDHASMWYCWGPEEGDEIEISEGEYRTGIMYLTAVIPKGDQYRILASGVKPEANRKGWTGFQDMSFAVLMERCAAECGMSARIFGGDGDRMIPYALRRNEGCAAFLDRIGRAEGYLVKAYDGAFRAVNLEYAEGMYPVARMNITTETGSVIYRRRRNLKYSALTVKSPWAEVTANDADVERNHPKTVTSMPATSAMLAGRWARNLLKDHNRQAEEMIIEQALNTSMSALSRVDVEGNTEMCGSWIVEEAEHDFINETSSAKLYRVIDSIR